MKRVSYIFVIFGLLFLAGVLFYAVFRGITPGKSAANNLFIENQEEVFMEDGLIKLPQPTLEGGMSLTEALVLRRSDRSYADQSLTVSEVSQLLWSAQGVTNERGFRTAPSAGATFPLEMFIMVNNVSGLDKGVYHYNPFNNTLEMVLSEDVSSPLMRASLSQSMIVDAGVVLIFGAVFERTTERYGERGYRYVYNEIGHASQNVHLQAAALGMGTVVIGAYRDEEVEEVLQLGPEIRVLYMMPVGKLD